MKTERMRMKWLSIKRSVGMLVLWGVQRMMVLAAPCGVCDTVQVHVAPVISDSSVVESRNVDSLNARFSRYEMRKSRY